MDWRKKIRRHPQCASILLGFFVVWFHSIQAATQTSCRGFDRDANVPKLYGRTALGLSRGGESTTLVAEGDPQIIPLAGPSEGNVTEIQILPVKRRRWFGRDAESSTVRSVGTRERKRWFAMFDSKLNMNNNSVLVPRSGPTTPITTVATDVLVENISSPAMGSATSISAVPATSRGGALVKDRPPKRNWFLTLSTHKFVETIKTDATRVNDTLLLNTTESASLILNEPSATKEYMESSQRIRQNAPTQIPEQQKVEDKVSENRKKPDELGPMIKVAEPTTSYGHQLRPTKHNQTQHITFLLPHNITAFPLKEAYLSSGYWSTIDQIVSLGLARNHPKTRVSVILRPLRKAAARVTGMHGFLSGKPQLSVINQEQIARVRRRLAAIDRAKKNLDELSMSVSRTSLPFRIQGKKKKSECRYVLREATEQNLREKWKQKRMKEIGKEMHETQHRLARLAWEKDVLQERFNPFWNYSVPDESAWTRTTGSVEIKVEREFIFPPEDLVDEYLDMLFATGRLTKLNHTDLWRRDSQETVDDDDELSGPPSSPPLKANQRDGNSESTSGNWFLRNGLGELIGEKAELAAYKAVCKVIMEILAKALSSLHGVTVMDHSDIRIKTEETPQLPPFVGHIPGSKNYRDYAVNAFSNAIRSGSRRPQSRRDNNFIQKAAIVESLTSQCQLAAPIMNLFPLTWQRAIISNIISLVTAVIADFCEGIEFQVLGHKLSFSFTPITQEEMLQRLYAHGTQHHRKDTRGFEEAVQATAITLSENLKLFDRWHQRALGSGLLVMQISTLIARLVLFLVDDILCASRMDLWSAHTGGPRLLASLEYRTSTQSSSAGKHQEPSGPSQ